MSVSIAYLKEKLTDAVYDLATGEGDARSRVKIAFHRFWTILPEEYPAEIPELLEDHNEILHLLTRLGGETGYVIPNNLRRMRNSTAAEVARIILRMHGRISALNVQR